jgi:hypothetical protein
MEITEKEFRSKWILDPSKKMIVETLLTKEITK